MITGINESKILAKHADVNLSLIVENVTRINIEIKVNIGMIVKKKKKKKKKKKIIYIKKIIFGILLLVVAKTLNISKYY